MKIKNKHEFKSRLHLYLIIPIFITGLMLGYLIKSNQDVSPNDSGGTSELHQGGYKFINPLLECEIAKGKINKLISSFKTKLSALIEKKIRSGMVTEAAVYFRDLNNGPWYGINEEDKFLTGSLLKVPVMMAYFKLAESEPGILSKRVLFEHKYIREDRVQTILPAREIEPGKEYTIAELIESAIIYSDNQTLPLLYQNLPDEPIANLYKILGFDIAALGFGSDPNRELDFRMSVKSYSSFFRILYNASYLDEEYSEKALQLLSKVDYKEGLRAGIPANITVAHKFGEEGIIDGERQLHDCGIIYHPQKPYLLCVMTRGGKIADLDGTIRDISKFVYENVQKNTQ